MKIIVLSCAIVSIYRTSYKWLKLSYVLVIVRLVTLPMTPVPTPTTPNLVRVGDRAMVVLLEEPGIQEVIQELEVFLDH